MTEWLLQDAMACLWLASDERPNNGSEVLMVLAEF
jgi:hypothetical protein